MIDIDHKQRVRQAAHVLDTADAALQLVHLTGAHQRLFLGERGKGAVGLLRFKFAQALDRGANGLVIGEHPAQPAVADVRHTGALGLFFDNLARRALGADK